MDPLQKASELYMGKRGFLFWSQQVGAAGGGSVLRQAQGLPSAAGAHSLPPWWRAAPPSLKPQLLPSGTACHGRDGCPEPAHNLLLPPLQAATWSVGILLVSWVVFRFVGPALGLYQLSNDLSTPNLL